MIPSDLIERASAVRIEDEIERRGIKLVGRVDRCGPCPHAAARIASASTSGNRFSFAAAAPRAATSSPSCVFSTAAASSRPSSI
jgi:hypothetical protein